MSSRRRGGQSPGGGSAAFGVLFIIAILWWLRWFILAAAVIALLILVTRWLVRVHAQRSAIERGRLEAVRRRCDTQNTQVLNGNPAGFFGEYPLPDPELIPAWYR